MSEMEGDSLGQAVWCKIVAKKSLSRQDNFIACGTSHGEVEFNLPDMLITRK